VYPSSQFAETISQGYLAQGNDPQLVRMSTASVAGMAVKVLKSAWSVAILLCVFHTLLPEYYFTI